MVRGEGISAYEEPTGAAAGERTFAAGRKFEDLRIEKGSNGRLTGKNAGFTLLIVVLDVSQQEKATAGCGQCRDAGVGSSDRVGNRAAGCWNVFFDGVVGLDQQTSDKKGWNCPFPLFAGEVKRGGPEILLVEDKVLR